MSGKWLGNSTNAALAPPKPARSSAPHDRHSWAHLPLPAPARCPNPPASSESPRNPLGTVIRQNTPHLTVNAHELLDGDVPCPESANNGRAALVAQEHGPPKVGVVIQELHEVLCTAGGFRVPTGQVHEDTLQGTRRLAGEIDDLRNSTLDRLRRGTAVEVLLNPG